MSYTQYYGVSERMALASLNGKIREILKSGFFNDPDDLVDVVIVSRKFEGKRMKEKQDLIWSELAQKLPPDECGKVSLSVGVSPEEIKAL